MTVESSDFRRLRIHFSSPRISFDSPKVDFFESNLSPEEFEHGHRELWAKHDWLRPVRSDGRTDT